MLRECYVNAKTWLTGRGPAMPEPAEKILGINVRIWDDEARLTKSSNRDGLGVDGLSNKSSEDEGNGKLEHVVILEN